MPQMIWTIAGYVAVGLSLSGNIGVVRKKRWGMALWVAANFIWIAYNLSRNDWPSFFLFSAYLALSIWGFVSWTKPAPQTSLQS